MADFDREHDTGKHRTWPVRRRGEQEPDAATHATCEPRRVVTRRPRRRSEHEPRPRASRLRAPLRIGGDRSRLAPLLHALFFIAAAAQSAIVPLLPRLSHAYGLSPSAGALLLAAPGLATLAVSMPAGVLADRLGARKVTVAATLLMSAAAIAQAAPSYLVLIGGRLAFGLAYGVVWTTGVAWMSSSHGESGSPRLGAVVTSAAVGMIAGPAIGGIVADRLGLSAPFMIVAVLAAALAALLWRHPGDTRATRITAGNVSMREFVRVVPRHPGVLVGAGVLAIGGAVGGATQLLIPLQLHRAGFSASGTGIAFSAAAGVYIVVSAYVVRLGRRATTPRRAALAGLALSLSLLPAALGVSALALVGVLAISTVPRAIVSTISYPLATDSAAGSELPEGIVIGLLNGTWATGLVLAPLIAGAIDQAAGLAPAYLAAVVPGALGALWLLARAQALRAAADPMAANARPAYDDASEPPTGEHELAVAPA